mgnify:CR=1 FL=1
MSALTTLAEVKAYLGIAPSDTSQDALIEILRPAIEEAVEQYCDTEFDEKITEREIHDGFNADVIVPFNFPVIEIQKVVLGCDTRGDGGDELEPTDYYVDDDGSVILRGRLSPHRRGSVRLDYRYGYEEVLHLPSGESRASAAPSQHGRRGFHGEGW